MRFIVDSDLPDNVQSISLSYALFDITELSGGQAQLEAVGHESAGGD
jgi:cytochrome c oxidase assembly protein Cox11